VTGLALVALLCRTSDRWADGAQGAAELAAALGDARTIGSPGEPRDGRWDEDLAGAHGCLLEAGGQIEDALGGGRMPVLVAGDCSICMTTLPTIVRLVPEVRVLWLDAHGDFNTPDTTPSGFLGGMCLAGDCGLWDTGFDGALDPRHVILTGVRDLDDAEAAALEQAGVVRADRCSEVADAVDGHDVFVHLDLDVLEDWPALFPAPGGFSARDLERMLDEVAQAAQRIVGLEITSCAPGHAEVAARAVAPLLPG
jgi:arginase family enzyme